MIIPFVNSKTGRDFVCEVEIGLTHITPVNRKVRILKCPNSMQIQPFIRSKQILNVYKYTSNNNDYHLDATCKLNLLNRNFFTIKISWNLWMPWIKSVESVKRALNMKFTIKLYTNFGRDIQNWKSVFYRKHLYSQDFIS